MKSNLKVLTFLIAIINQSELATIIESSVNTQSIPLNIKSVQIESLELFDIDSEEKFINLEESEGQVKLNIPNNSSLELFEGTDSYWSPGPRDVNFEIGTIQGNSLIYFQYFRMTTIPGRIARLVVKITLERIIHGIRIQSFNDTGRAAQIIDGGINHYFMTIRFIGRTDHFLFLVEGFHDRTTTSTTASTLAPDYEIEHWGTVGSGSILLSENRHYYYPKLMMPADKIIAEKTDREIHAMRLYALNGTRGDFKLIEGGLGHEFVTFRFFGESLGRGFDFRLELYENCGNLEDLSVILIAFLAIAHLSML